MNGQLTEMKFNKLDYLKYFYMGMCTWIWGIFHGCR